MGNKPKRLGGDLIHPHDAVGRTKGQDVVINAGKKSEILQVLPEADLASLSYLGLKELTLSANPGITAKGWGRLAIAVAHSSQVRVLNLDYNPLGERSTGIWSFFSPSGVFYWVDEQNRSCILEYAYIQLQNCYRTVSFTSGHYGSGRFCLWGGVVVSVTIQKDGQNASLPLSMALKRELRQV